MPYKPKRPCRQPGCKNFAEHGAYCAEHAQYRENRLSASQRGYDSKWRHSRDMFLREHPLCAECMRNGRIVPATVVDHVIPHRGNQSLFWDVNNWQALCKECHDEKTGKGL